MTPEDLIALEMFDEQCSEETKNVLVKLQCFLEISLLALIEYCKTPESEREYSNEEITSKFADWINNMISLGGKEQ